MGKNPKISNLTDYVNPDIKFEFMESDDVDGEYVLAKVKGEFFVPDGISRNKRFYPKKLWENVLSQKGIQEKFKNKNMYGTIGHKTELDDEAMQEGKISHIVTSAYIGEDGKGMGEALILNTPTGNILNTVLRAGSSVFVSSRANGRFNGNKNGVPVVDENKYDLKGWDFVLAPGFLEANPTIAEELQELENENTDTKDIKNIKGESKMDYEKMIEKLTNQNDDLKEKLSEKKHELKERIEESVSPIREENEHLKTQLHTAEENKGELEESLNKTNKELEEAQTVISQWDELGESFESVKAALEKSEEFTTKVTENFGTYSQIEEAFATMEESKTQWEELGSYEDVKAALEVSEKLIDEKKEADYQKKVDDVAKKLDVKAESVDKLMKKGMTEEEIEDFMKEMKGQKKKEEYGDKKDENLGDVSETEIKPTVSRASRLIEQLNK